jgi:hypothetical protein
MPTNSAAVATIPTRIPRRKRLSICLLHCAVGGAMERG